MNYPTTKVCSHVPGRRSAPSSRTKATRHVLKRGHRVLFRSYFTKARKPVPGFRLGGAFGVVPELPRRTADDTTTTTTRKKYSASHFARDRACWPARAASGRWAWRGRGARCGSRRVRVVCRAERHRDKIKRKRRSGVMVCVSVFVTHQKARSRFHVVP